MPQQSLCTCMSKKVILIEDELIQKLIEQSKAKTTKAEVVNALNDLKDEETREDGSSTEGCIPDTTEGTGELGGGSNSN